MKISNHKISESLAPSRLKETDGVVITFGEVAALDHKVLYNSVKRGAFVAQLFACYFSGSLFTCEEKRSTASEISHNRIFFLRALSDDDSNRFGCFLVSVKAGVERLLTHRCTNRESFCWSWDKCQKIVERQFAQLQNKKSLISFRKAGRGDSSAQKPLFTEQAAFPVLTPIIKFRIIAQRYFL